MEITKEQAKALLSILWNLKVFETLMRSCYENNKELKLAEMIFSEFPEFREMFSNLWEEKS